MCRTNGTKRKLERKKEENKQAQKYNKCTVNEVTIWCITIACTSDFKNELDNKTKPSRINMHSNKSTKYTFCGGRYQQSELKGLKVSSHLECDQKINRFADSMQCVCYKFCKDTYISF